MVRWVGVEWGVMGALYLWACGAGLAGGVIGVEEVQLPMSGQQHR